MTAASAKRAKKHASPKRTLRPRPPMTYEAGIRPDVVYPLTDFLVVARMTRAKFAYAKRRAKEMGIDLVRDTGSPSVRGADYLNYVEKCAAYDKPRGRIKKANPASA